MAKRKMKEGSKGEEKGESKAFEREERRKGIEKKFKGKKK